MNVFDIDTNELERYVAYMKEHGREEIGNAVRARIENEKQDQMNAWWHGKGPLPRRSQDYEQALDEWHRDRFSKLS